jgi:uncharacterized protein
MRCLHVGQWVSFEETVMDDPALLKPALYRGEGTDAEPEHPALLGGACLTCGYLFFPLQAYGCERCGGLDLAPRPIAGAGTLLASARVHLHTGKGREAPFTVAAVALDDGPIVRTLVADGSHAPRAGERMVTVLALAADAEGAPRLDLRFIAEA